MNWTEADRQATLAQDNYRPHVPVNTSRRALWIALYAANYRPVSNHHTTAAIAAAIAVKAANDGVEALEKMLK